MSGDGEGGVAVEVDARADEEILISSILQWYCEGGGAWNEDDGGWEAA